MKRKIPIVEITPFFNQAAKDIKKTITSASPDNLKASVVNFKDGIVNSAVQLKDAIPAFDNLDFSKISSVINEKMGGKSASEDKKTKTPVKVSEKNIPPKKEPALNPDPVTAEVKTEATIKAAPKPDVSVETKVFSPTKSESTIDYKNNDSDFSKVKSNEVKLEEIAVLPTENVENIQVESALTNSAEEKKQDDK